MRVAYCTLNQLDHSPLVPFGGNMDYDQMKEGATLYLPVFHQGGLLMSGDILAAMGDGELTGSALETSADVELTVDLFRGFATSGLEDLLLIGNVGIVCKHRNEASVVRPTLVYIRSRETKTKPATNGTNKYEFSYLWPPRLVRHPRRHSCLFVPFVAAFASASI